MCKTHTQKDEYQKHGGPHMFTPRGDHRDTEAWSLRGPLPARRAQGSGASPRYSSAFTSSPAASVPAPPSWLSVVPAPTVARRRLLRVTTQLATENTPSNTVCWARLDRLASLSTQGLGLYANIWRVFSPKVSGNLARTQCLGVVVTYM